MDQLKIRQQSRHKPRHKISYQAGYNVWGKKKLKNFYRKKWSKIRRGNVMTPPFSRKRSLKDLFGERLRCKQVLRKMYGKLTEAQLQTVFNRSEFGYSKSSQSFNGLLDRRFDAFIYRIGFAKTIFKARQDILHGSFKINGKVVKAPGSLVNVGDFVSPNENSWESIYLSFKNRLKLRIERKRLHKPSFSKKRRLSKKIKSALPVSLNIGRRAMYLASCKKHQVKKPSFSVIPLPGYIEFDFRTLTAIVIESPNQNNILSGSKVNLKLVREFYK